MSEAKVELVFGEPFDPWKVWDDFTLMPSWLRQLPRTSISPGAKITYSVLLRFIGLNRKAWPSEAAIAKEVGYSVRQIQRYLAELRRLRLIRVTLRRLSGKTSEYETLWHPWCVGGTTEVSTGGTTEVAGEARQKWRMEKNQGKESDRKESNAAQRARTEPPLATLEGKSARATVDNSSSLLQSKLGNSVALSSKDLSPKDVGTEDHGSEDTSTASVEPEDLAAGESPSPTPAPKQDLQAVIAAAKGRTQAKLAAAASKRASRAARRAQNASNLQGRTSTPSERKALRECEEALLGGLRTMAPDVRFGGWAGKERGQCRLLLERYPLDVVLGAFRYVLETWPQLQKRFNVGAFPSLGWVLALHSTLVPESQRYVRHASTQDKLADFYRDNPGAFLPTNLRVAATEAEEGMKALGLGA